MDKIITFGHETRKRVLEGIHMLRRPVQSTHGPNGRNVIINKGNTQPVFTKDGESPKQAAMDKETCLNELRELYMGEWRELYDSNDYGSDILDGTSWSVVIHYKNGLETVGFAGNNAFPYNFGHFNNLITGGLI